MGLTKQETCWWRKTDLTTCEQWCTGIDTAFTFTTTGWNDWTDLQLDCWLCLIRMLQARLEIGDLEGLSISLGKKLSCKMQGTLEIGVFVAIANDLILILRGKGLQAVIDGNEAEMDETGLEAEGKGNGGKSVLFNLKDTAILFDLLNLLLWLRQITSLETSVELNIDSANFRFPFSTRCNLSE